MMTLFSYLLVIFIIIVSVMLSRKLKRFPVRGVVPPPKPFPPVPEWEPAIPVDLKRITAAFSYYNTYRKTFVVFQHGTCVLVDPSSTNIEQDARQTLDQVYKYHPDFRSLKMGDGHWMVEYVQPVYSIVFQEEVQQHWKGIEKNYRKGICPDEVLSDPDGKELVFDESWKVGLFGRARMFMDAKNPIIVRTWKPHDDHGNRDELKTI